MIFSKATLAVIATSFVLLLTQSPVVESHSYVDCVDWRFNKGAKTWHDKDGACFGYARRFPLKAKPFAKLDSDDPNRHYQQRHNDVLHALPCSNGKEGEEPGADETMAMVNGKAVWGNAYKGTDKRGRKVGVQTTTHPGGQLCIRWPAKNHAVPDEKNQPVTIAFSKTANQNKDPNQIDFLSNVIVKLNYKNCTNKNENTDIWPCGGCFTVPQNTPIGNVVMQWRWKLNSNEYYASCADLNVVKK
ncbi:hypothetical protein BGZ83_008282 [Gryganskiella cystojenkinii]|nr:hypothetical protein BGZ83_008282 [Gryganskiella cystojenkinii]